MSRLEDYVSDAVCDYLEADDVDEREPIVTQFELGGTQVVCFKINGHVLCYDIFDILWKGLDVIRVEDDWRKY